MPEADETAVAPKPKRGRPPKVAAKRKDPAETPILTRLGHETIFNKVPGKRYALLSADDIPEFRYRGYIQSERRPDREDKPAWDMGSDSDAGYSFKGLVQYECDEERARLFEEPGIEMHNRRMAAIHEAAKQTGGYMTQKLER